MWSVSDEALLAGLAADDAAAAEAFVARFQRRVVGLARTIVGDAQAAEDVAQEALLRAWRHAESFDARRGSVATWLLAITRNLAIDAVRVRRPVAIDPETIFGLGLLDTGPAPAELAVAHDDAEQLRRALRELPEEQCRAIALAGILGWTAQEVADSEGIPLGTAKTRIRAAMIKLRTILVEEERAE